MSQNNIPQLTVSQLIALTQSFHDAIDPMLNPYGITAAELTALQSAITTLTNAASAKDNDYMAARASTQAQTTGKAALIAAFRPLVNSIYANPNLTSQQIAAVGLAVRDSSGTPVIPQTPTGLDAVPSPNGYVDVSWNRSGNPQGVIFTVQTSPDAIAWTNVASLTATRTTLLGFAPGVEAFFRVFASVGSAVSLPGGIAVIYAPSGQATGEQGAGEQAA